jgi:hypothetical protein
VFHGLSFWASLFTKEHWGQSIFSETNQASATKGSNDLLEVVGFVLGKGKGKREEEGGDEPRVARDESQRQRAGRLFAAR